jgi:hypothetical protein
LLFQLNNNNNNNDKNEKKNMQIKLKNVILCSAKKWRRSDGRIF